MISIGNNRRSQPRYANEGNTMHGMIDNLVVGQKISLRYSKDGGLSQGYTGLVESVRGSVVTLKILNKGFRSFSVEKILGIMID